MAAPSDRAARLGRGEGEETGDDNEEERTKLFREIEE